MSFNHSVRIVKKIEGRNISGLRLSKLSARCGSQRCIIYNKAVTDYGDIEMQHEKFHSPGLTIRKIGKSMEILSESCGDFFKFLSKLPFQDDKVIDFADAYNEFFLNGQFITNDSLESNQNVNKTSELQGVIANACHVEKEKDAIILYINIQDDNEEIPCSEDVIFSVFEDMAKKYNLGIIYDGFEEVLDEQKI